MNSIIWHRHLLTDNSQKLLLAGAFTNVYSVQLQEIKIRLFSIIIAYLDNHTLLSFTWSGNNSCVPTSIKVHFALKESTKYFISCLLTCKDMGVHKALFTTLKLHFNRCRDATRNRKVWSTHSSDMSSISDWWDESQAHSTSSLR